MKQMKSAILFALLVCLLSQPAQALTGPEELLAPLPVGEQLLGMVAYQGGLLVRTSQGFYHYLEDQEPQTLVKYEGNFFDGSPNVAFLTAKGEQLYGYHPVQGAVYPFSLRDGLQMGAAIPLDLFDMSVSDGVMTLPYQPHQFLVFEERFYLLFHQDAEGGMDGRLLSFDLLGLDRKDINIPLVRQLAPYQEGQLLCLAEKEAGIVGPGQLHVFLPKDGSLTALGRTGQQLKAFGAGLAYDPDSQDVYYQSGSQLFVWHAEGKDSLVAHLGSEFMLPGSGMVLIRPGLLAFGHGLGISIRQTKPPQLDTRELVIRGGYPDRQHELAASLMPDAHIRFIETTYQSTALQKALILGDDSFDIYQLGAQDINTKSLMEKGYALPLQGEVISRHMARLHPVLCDMGTLNGKTMLLPVDLRLKPLYVNQGLFEELGLRIPRSLEELLAFITDYPQDAEVPLFEEPPTRDELLNLASTLWYARSKRMGVPLRFDEPAFLSVLEALGATPNFPQRDLLQDTRAALFPYGNELNFSYWSSYRAFSSQMEPLFLSFLADEEPLVIGTLTLLAISPHSHQQQTALRYLENKLLSMDDLHCASMYLQAPKGIKNPGFDQLIKRGEAYLNALKTAAQEAEGAQRSNLTQQLQQYEETFDENLEKHRFLVTEDILQEYQQLALDLVILDEGYALLMQAGAPAILRRALSGQVSAQIAAQELDGRLSLMQAEQK